MGTYILIKSTSMRSLNKAEKVNLLKRFMALMPQEDEGPEIESVRAAGDVSALNISAEQVERMNTLIAALEEQTLQSTATAETPEMQQLDAERDTVGNYIVSRILDYNRLPLAAEREAARQLEPAFRPYRGFYDMPVQQETAVIQGLLADLAKPEYAEALGKLQLTAAISELKRLNDRYVELSATRDAVQRVRSGGKSTAELAAEAQDLLDDMCALANASALLQPSDEATEFVEAVNFLFARVRAAYNQRDKSRPAKGGDDAGGDSDRPVVPGEEDGKQN